MKRIFFLLFLAGPLFVRAATITVVNQDAGGEGLNDPTPVAPVGGNTGTTIGQQRLIVMQRAAALWGARVVSSVTIQIGAKFDPLTCSGSSAVLGSAGPHTFFRDFVGAPKSGTYFAVALANALAGTDLDPASVDVDAQFNSNLGHPGCLSSVDWYYGLDGNAPGGTIDFLHVVLHEFVHGLGFVSTVDLASGAKLNGFNDAFMSNLEDHSTGKLYPNMSNAERVAASKDVGDLHWAGTNVVAASDFLASGRHASGHVLMYAPNPAQPGSSVSHFDVALSPNELMEPFANPATDRRLTEQQFRDTGWTVLPPLLTNGQSLVSETCVNGAIDPGETVTVDLTLTNIGFADTANLLATLLSTNGVTDPGAAQNFGAMTILGPSVTRSFTFTASGQCGDLIRPTLQLHDGSTDYGTLSFEFRLGALHDYTNSSSIVVPSSGAATPYPSTIIISNHPGPVNGLAVRLLGLGHANPDDLDILLVGPGGRKALIMSDCGGSPTLANVTLTLSGFAAANLPDSSQLTNGTYRPADYDAASDTFSAPAPGGPYGSSLSVFDGTSPNGTWQLFVLDDHLPSSGSLAGGWALVLPECCSSVPNQPPALVFGSPSTNYLENTAPLAIANDAGVTDSDSPSFNGGTLTVAFTTNGTAADRLGIRDDGSAPGQIGVVGNTVSFGGLAIGDYSGGTSGSSPLVVNFTSANATPAAAQALCRAITFSNASDTPSPDPRHVLFTVTDGMDGSATAAKTVTVIAVNDTPAISAVMDFSVAEDSSTGPVPFLVGDAETAASALVVSGTSSNVALVPLSNIVFGGSDSNRTVTISPATNQFGTTLITLLVTDGQATNSASFLIAVTGVNDSPTISTVLDQSIAEDTSSAAINFTIGDAETAASALVVSATSSNLALVPLANMTLGGSISNRTITLQPATNQFGTTLITLLVTDGQATNSTNFLLTVTAVNDAPLISPVLDQSIPEDTGTGPINFTVGDVETVASALVVSGTSSNVALVPLSNIVFGGSDSNRTVTISPATNQFGTTLITLLVTDGQATNSASFLLTITAVNDSPMISSVLDQSIAEDTGTGPINFTIGDVETAAGALVVSGTSSNIALVPLSNIVFGGSDSNRTVTISPATNQFGTTLITLLVTDGQATSSASFLLTVTSVNGPPIISSVLDQFVQEDTITGPINFTIGDVETAAGALAVSATSSNLALVPSANIAFGGSDSNRTVTISPATNQFGATLITLLVTDGQATNSASFLLTVTSVNDAPIISSVLDQFVPEDTIAGPINFTIGDAETAAGALVVSAISTNLSLVPSGNIVLGGSDSNRTVSIVPVTNEFGTTLITLTVSDGEATNRTSFLLTVTAVNDGPTISSVQDQSIPEGTDTGPISFTIGDAETPASALVVSVTSSNLTLVPLANVALGGSDSNRTVTISPVTNQFGTALITVLVSDGQATNRTSFLLTVTAVNDGPTISVVLDQSTLEDVGPGLINFTVGDAETAAGALVVTATSSNLPLVPVAGIFFGGSDSNRTVSIVPGTNEFGTTLITLFVTDGQVTNSSSFLLTVTPVNDAPTLDPLSDVTMVANSGAFAVNLAGITAGPTNELQSLSVLAFVSAPALLADPLVGYQSPAAGGSLLLTPRDNAAGTSVVSVVVMDAGGTTNGGIEAVTNTFNVIVLPVVDVGVSGTATFAGTNLVVTVTLTNSGPHLAQNLSLTNLVPAGATVLSVSSDAASCVDTNGAVVCSFPALPASTSAVTTFTLAVEPRFFFTNVALVASSEIDTDAANNLAITVVPMGGDQDFDADGMPDAWELAQGTDPGSPDATDDPDGDGLTNLQEYFAGTNPHDASSVLRITGITVENGTSMVLSFFAVSNRNYSILSSTNLAPGSWAKVLDVPAAPGSGLLTVTNTIGPAPVLFYRVVTGP